MTESDHVTRVTKQNVQAFLSARDFLLAHRGDYETAYRDFRWPRLDTFNWALDYFDPFAHANTKTALWIVNDDGAEVKLSFAEMSRHSGRGDKVRIDRLMRSAHSLHFICSPERLGNSRPATQMSPTSRNLSRAT